MSINVTEEGVSALQNMASSVEELTTTIHAETEELKSVFETNQAGLGAHSQSISDLIDEVEGTEQDATIPVKKLALKLQRAAINRWRVIENDPFQRNNNSKTRWRR